MSLMYGGLGVPKEPAGVRGRSPVPRVDCSMPNGTAPARRGMPVPKRRAASPGRRELGDDGNTANEFRRMAMARRPGPAGCGQCGFFDMCGLQQPMEEPEELVAEQERWRGPAGGSPHFLPLVEAKVPLVQAPAAGARGSPTEAQPQQHNKDRNCTLDVNDCL
mmetsp:Transcript_89786/g.209148  ORF Transcript_89786/g.209148 Transcript_89786/m.209148 type:complete len:163 (+) Transcript_89786:77-565(+)